VSVVDTHGSCNSWFLVLSMLLSWVSISVVGGVLVGRSRCCSLGILILSVVHLRLRRLHGRGLHLSLLLRVWCSVLMSRGLRVLRLCRGSGLNSRVLSDDLRGVCRLRVYHVVSRWTARRGRSRKGYVAGNTGRSFAVCSFSAGMGSSQMRLVNVRSGRMSATIRVAVEVLALLASTHANFTSNANTTSLVSHGAAELGAGRKSREFLGTVDSERLRLDFQAMGDLCFSLSSGGCSCLVQLVCVLWVLQLLVQAKAQSVLSLVTDRKIGEDEVSSLIGAIQVNHASDRSASQDGQAGRIVRDTALGDWTGLFQSRKQEVVCVHGEGDIIVFVLLAIKDAELDDWRRVDRTTVGRS